MVHLHVHSWHSWLAAASSPDALAVACQQAGQTALALTDTHSIAGVVQFARACKKADVRPIYGAEIFVDGYPLVFLCTSREGYANLCDLITLATDHDRFNPSARLCQLKEHAADLICLTGDRFGYLQTALRAGHYRAAETFATSLLNLFGDHFYIELTHHRREGDAGMMARLVSLAKWLAVPTVATNAVRHAEAGGYATYDAMRCAGLGITISDFHELRPVTNQAYVKSAAEMRALGFPEVALRNTAQIAELCRVELLPEAISPPQAIVPTGITAANYLRHLCEKALPDKYPSREAKRDAKAVLERELATIQTLELDEFFLVVREVTEYSKSVCIRCTGRGSAANSIVAYLLGITNVDPIKYRLLFERFLHTGRRGMPDIDLDFPSDRRDEVIAWMHERFSDEHTAMSANFVTMQLRLAVREMAKVLGYPLTLINRATKAIPHAYGANVKHYRAELASVLGDSPMLDTLILLVEAIGGAPRHLSLQAGGMVLSRTPIRYLSPVQTSSNGVRQIQLDKDAIEGLGQLKLDILGLRALSVVCEAVDHLLFDQGIWLDLDRIPLDDEPTFELIRSGRTLGLFQIESPGQWNLISRAQPEVFDDLIAQIALFRPGPLQGGMVNPWVARRRGLEKVTYPHPSLEPVLKDTYGVILYQEQVLEIAHVFAGLTLSEADDFRRLMSKFRSSEEMEGMRERFVNGAIATHGASPVLANSIFNMVAHYVGYGFCKSHSASFAQLVYQTAYLKTHFPAHYMAAALEHHPGFYPINTLVEEAKLCGVKMLPVAIHHSRVKYGVEQGAIRVPLTAVDGISAEAATKVVLARAEKEFASLEDAYRRVSLPRNIWEGLIQAGAFDSFGDRRRVLWELGVLVKQIGASGQSQQALPPAAFPREAIPELAKLDLEGITQWNFKTTHLTTTPHPLALCRSRLKDYGVMPIARLTKSKIGMQVMVAGVVISRQHPPTANGMTFLVVEDETGRVPMAVIPPVYAQYYVELRAEGLLVEGRLEGSGAGQIGDYRSVLIEKMWVLQRITGTHAGGYSSFPGEMAH